jgi:hypothetical protein
MHIQTNKMAWLDIETSGTQQTQTQAGTASQTRTDNIELIWNYKKQGPLVI